MRLEKRGRVWHTWVYVAGKRRYITTGCHDKQAATVRAAQLERDYVDPAATAVRDATMSAALDAMVAKKMEEASAGNLAADTVEFYKGKAANLLRYFETNAEMTGAPEGQHVPFPLAALEARQVDSYISHRRKAGATESTISKELVTLRITLKIAKRAKLFPVDIAEVLPVSFAPKYEPVKRVLTIAELQKLLSTLPADRAARLAFAVATSANLGETNAALREDVLDDGATVHIRGTKTDSRDRMVPMVTEFSKTLLAYAVKHAGGTDGKLFTSWKKIGRDVYAACDRVDIPHCSTNDWRRTFATWMRASGAAPSLIAPCMGHADSRMVERVYGRLQPEQLRALLAKDLGIDSSNTVANQSDLERFFAPIALSDDAKPAELNAPAQIRTGGPRIRSPITLWPNPREEQAISSARRRTVAQLQQLPRPDGCVPLPEAARLMGVAYTTLWDFCRRGEVPHTLKPKTVGGRVLAWIHERDIARFRQARQVATICPERLPSAP